MKNTKKLLIMTMTMVFILGITCLASDFLVSFGSSNLRPGDSASSSKCTLQSEVKEFYVNQYVNVANTTEERFTVYRYDGIFQVKKVIAEKYNSLSKNQNNVFSRIPLLSTVPYVPEKTNVGLMMTNTGNSSFDIKSGNLYKYR